MEIISLKCNNCGGDLNITQNIKYLRCGFCNSSLMVKKSGNAVFTEVLNEINTTTKNIEATTDKILIEKRVARLDREWKIKQESFKFKNNIHPEKEPPISEGFFLLASIIIILISTLITFFNNAYFFSFIALLLGILILYYYRENYMMPRKEYFHAKDKYEKERNKILYPSITK